jgi:hypothetical protein
MEKPESRVRRHNRLRVALEQRQTTDQLVFPWNGMIGLTGGDETRGIGISLSAIHDALKAIHAELVIMNEGR